MNGIVEARRLIAQSERVLAFTGAGISAESGIPIFRGAGGLWKQFRPEDLATPEAFRRDPKLVWEWYNWRRGLIAQAEPNPGHFALAALEGIKPGFVLVTQNVDGLHERAGSRRVYCVHGDIWTLRCLSCGRARRDESAMLPELPPQCTCGSIQRPGVVWFGEALNPAVLSAAEGAASRADVLLSIGTSAVVFPAAGLINIARAAGAAVIEVNPEETPYSNSADCALRGPAGEILPELVGQAD